MKYIFSVLITLFCFLSTAQENVFNEMYARAQSGDAEAQNNLAYCYMKGHGVKQDLYKAYGWYQKSAAQGNIMATFNLAQFYYSGIVVKKDLKEAFKWYKVAAEAGLAEAQNVVGCCYAYGQGVSKDYELALDYFRMASEGGSESAKNNLAKMEKIYGTTSASQPESANVQKRGSVKSAKEQKHTSAKSDIDVNIPATHVQNDNTFVVIIANEDYQEEINVAYAINDGRIFNQYCRKTLGIPEKNIHFVENATYNNIRREVNWLTKLVEVYNGEAKVIFYYAGHGIPDVSTGDSYLLPVDGFGSDIMTGYPLKELYASLTKMPAKSVTVFLDACFSGSTRDDNMMQAARGISIKVKDVATSGNIVVFSATQGDDTAHQLDEKQHGLFTYYLCKKLQETKGNVSYYELSDYITNKVRQESTLSLGKTQTPSVNASITLGEQWKSWTLK